MFALQLTLCDIDICDEGKTLDDTALLSEIMEYRFEIEECSGSDELKVGLASHKF